MIRKLLLASVCVNILFVAVFVGSSNSRGGKLVVVTEEELTCLSSWHKKIYEKMPIYGPGMLSEHYVIRVEGIPDGVSFQSELSGCFYSAYMTSTRGIKEFLSTFEFFQDQEGKNIGFYKSAYNSDIHLFAKSKK